MAVKLFLALIWRSAAPPFDSAIPARAWAVLLDLPDPAGKGARRISAALRALERESLVVVERKSGRPPRVTLLDESGDGSPYSLPSSAYTRAGAAAHRTADEVGRHRYFKVGSPLWRTGEVQAMSGPALVMLLILLAERGGEGMPVWFSTSAFHERYRISHQTRSTGTRELLVSGLVRIERESVALSPRASTFDPLRTRNVYSLTPAARA